MADSADNQRLFALRGAASIEDNTEQAILDGHAQAGAGDHGRNDLAAEQMVSCVFSATTDLNAQFPAVAARDLGLRQRAAAVHAGDRGARARCRA